MGTLVSQVAELLNRTLNPDQALVQAAAVSLDRLSNVPGFTHALISISIGGDSPGQRLAAATYLKNFTRALIVGENLPTESHHDFRNKLVQALLQVEPIVLKVLVEAFQIIIKNDFVKENSWPNLIPELRLVIQNSNLINKATKSQWNAINALTMLQAAVKPFQYFLNPKTAKEDVPSQLDLIAGEILAPLQSVFHNLLEKTLPFQNSEVRDTDRIILIICKCNYFAVRSYMPSSSRSWFPLFCRDILRILDSIVLDMSNTEDGHLFRLKIGKRCLLIFSALITRHRKHVDNLLPNIIDCVFKIVKQSPSVYTMNSQLERIVSLAFDVISHILETGPGWRLISSHFPSLLETAIFPALALNHKDIIEWEEDPDEYIRKNLPSDLEEVSGWNEDLFTARKSAINLLGVISMSKGSPVGTSSMKRKKGDKSKDKARRCTVGELLVIPFLSKFLVPSNIIGTTCMAVNDYYGVLMAYGGLQDFLRERNPEYTAILLKSRVLPIYSLSSCHPFLVATANWILGELAACLPQEIVPDVYSLLLKALCMSDLRELSYYPVRASAAGAISKLLENDCLPVEWLSLLQVLLNQVNHGDENDSSLAYQLLNIVVEVGQEKLVLHIPEIVSNLSNAISKHFPIISDPWPQVVERGFEALAVMAKTWEASEPEDEEANETIKWKSGWNTIAHAFYELLHQAWIIPLHATEAVSISIAPSCINESSALLGCVMRFIIQTDQPQFLEISELLSVWADLIADWHACGEEENLEIFSSISATLVLHNKCSIKNFFYTFMPSPPSPPVPKRSIIEGIGAFVSEALATYESATWRACSCAHLLLNTPKYSIETEDIKKSLAISFCEAAFSCFKKVQGKAVVLWKSPLLVISTCYLCYHDIVQKILENKDDNGFVNWIRSLSYIATSSFEPGLSSESEIKLIVLTLTKLVEWMMGSALDFGGGIVKNCIASLMEAAIHLKEIQEEENNEDDTNSDDINDDGEDEDSENDDDDEDSEDDNVEETEEEFLERYAKVAAELENGMVEEDVEDKIEELELGDFNDIDIRSALFSLIERHQEVITGQMHLLSPQLITSFLDNFPEYDPFFRPL